MFGHLNKPFLTPPVPHPGVRPRTGFGRQLGEKQRRSDHSGKRASVFSKGLGITQRIEQGFCAGATDHAGADISGERGETSDKYVSGAHRTLGLLLRSRFDLGGSADDPWAREVLTGAAQWDSFECKAKR